MSLADRTCAPCRGDTQALTPQQYQPLLSQLKEWHVLEGHRLHKEVKTKDFQQALDLANRIGAIAEEQQHHPDLVVRWGQLGIDLWTHAISGLSEADFIMAAKIDQAL